MLMLGLLLLAATGAFTGLVIADNMNAGPDTTVTAIGNDIATMSPLAMFLSGIALALILVIGGVLVLTGIAHARRRRADLRAARMAGTTRDPAAGQGLTEADAPVSRATEPGHSVPTYRAEADATQDPATGQGLTEADAPVSRGTEPGHSLPTYRAEADTTRDPAASQGLTEADAPVSRATEPRHSLPTYRAEADTAQDTSEPGPVSYPAEAEAEPTGPGREPPPDAPAQSHHSSGRRWRRNHFAHH
ncbi:hypothetical protein ACFYNO_25620 [Kitasatospora sp. NPDC006697]|uniref:hypothetical protein n=1 Tax=Kitasatospora sp. NPDC006697 TaxID=3364020 RepID=UPI00369D0118